METEYLANINNNADWFSPDEPATNSPVRKSWIGMFIPMDGDVVRLGFRLKDLDFLIPSDIYYKFVLHTQICFLPYVEPWFNSLLNLRVNVIAVIDLMLFLDRTAKSHGKRQLLTSDKGEKTIPIRIDGYPEIARVTSAQSPLLPELLQLLQSHTAPAVPYNKQIWLNIRLCIIQNTGQ